MILGLFLSIFHQASPPIRYECEACHTHFAKRALSAKIYLALFILIILTPFLVFAIAIAIIE